MQERFWASKSLTKTLRGLNSLRHIPKFGEPGNLKSDKEIFNSIYTIAVSFAVDGY